jgi:hypothetical protein
MKLEALRRQVGEQNLSKTLGMDPRPLRDSVPKRTRIHAERFALSFHGQLATPKPP